MITTTGHQLNLLHHTLGVTPTRREPYRNYFVAGPNHHDMSDLEALEDAGLMIRTRKPDFLKQSDIVFAVTDAGRSYALDNLQQPPKRTKYDEFLDADYGHDFAEWLGITLPRVEYDRDGNCQFTRVRRGNGWTERIEGEWKPTKKEAKASYKEALKARRMVLA